MLKLEKKSIAFYLQVWIATTLFLLVVDWVDQGGFTDFSFYLILLITIVCLVVPVVTLLSGESLWLRQQERVISAFRAFDDDAVFTALYTKACEVVKARNKKQYFSGPSGKGIFATFQEREDRIAEAEKEVSRCECAFDNLRSAVQVTHNIPPWYHADRFAEHDPKINPSHWQDAVKNNDKVAA